MNTSLKRFAAVMFVASALSGAAQAQFDLAKFNKQAETENIAMKFVNMRSYLCTLATDSIALADIKPIFAAIDTALVSVINKDAQHKTAVIEAIPTFRAILTNRIKKSDYPKVQEWAQALTDKINNPKKSGFVSAVGNGFSAIGNAFVHPIDTATALKNGAVEKLGFGKAQKALDEAETKVAFIAAEITFNTAFEAMITESLDKKAINNKSVKNLDALLGALVKVSNDSQTDNRNKEIDAVMFALPLAIKAVVKAEAIKKEATKIDNDKYSKLWINSAAKSKVSIARLTAEVVELQTKVNAALNGITVAGKQIVTVKLIQVATEANAAAVKYPVVK